MMVSFGKYFAKRLKKYPESIKRKVAERVVLFQRDPFHPLLHNHGLSGPLAGFRSINVTGDIRAVYRHVTEDGVRFEDIGTHSELYGS